MDSRFNFSYSLCQVAYRQFDYSKFDMYYPMASGGIFSFLSSCPCHWCFSHWGFNAPIEQLFSIEMIEPARRRLNEVKFGHTCFLILKAGVAVKTFLYSGYCNSYYLLPQFTNAC